MWIDELKKLPAKALERRLRRDSHLIVMSVAIEKQMDAVVLQVNSTKGSLVSGIIALTASEHFSIGEHFRGIARCDTFASQPAHVMKGSRHRFRSLLSANGMYNV